jgi:hypothetical protein
MLHLSVGGQVIREDPTIDINARNVDFSVYQRLYALKKRGKFSSWSVFLKWLVNNKSLFETFVDEIEKHIRGLKEDNP